MRRIYTCVMCDATTTRKADLHHCWDCGSVLCGRCAVSYVDGNNIAITKQSPALCRPCYVQRYGLGWGQIARERL